MTTLIGLHETLAQIDPVMLGRLEETTPPDLVQAGGLCVDLAHHVATFRGVLLGLTSTECAILDYLLRASGRIVSRDELSLHLRQRPHGKLERAIDMHISHLRKKLEPAADWSIRTVRGTGYRLVLTEPAADGGSIGC